jgi:hypothetical protein
MLVELRKGVNLTDSGVYSHYLAGIKKIERCGSFLLFETILFESSGVKLMGTGEMLGPKRKGFINKAVG